MMLGPSRNFTEIDRLQDQGCNAEDEMILVDRQDRAVGLGKKLDVHLIGTLHRGFSVLLYDASARLLLQQRAAGKYHFAGRWSNACCSHPRPGESTMEAATRRLQEELGVTASLTKAAELRYRAEDPESGLIEHEYLHIFIGRLAETPRPNPDEVGDWRWISDCALRRALRRMPHVFTPWFQLIMESLEQRKDNVLQSARRGA
jgi:isopentenyl-diphosphate delta-isomerase